MREVISRYLPCADSLELHTVLDILYIFIVQKMFIKCGMKAPIYKSQHTCT